jgi:hypothetical protein
MPTDLVYPEDVDAILNWPPGRASRLARSRKLPHYLLPDGAVRFRMTEIEQLVQRVTSSSTTANIADASKEAGRG